VHSDIFRYIEKNYKTRKKHVLYCTNEKSGK
jgi:hypothetical protein